MTKAEERIFTVCAMALFFDACALVGLPFMAAGVSPSSALAGVEPVPGSVLGWYAAAVLTIGTVAWLVSGVIHRRVNARIAAARSRVDHRAYY